MHLMHDPKSTMLRPLQGRILAGIIGCEDPEGVIACYLDPMDFTDPEGVTAYCLDPMNLYRPRRGRSRCCLQPPHGRYFGSYSTPASFNKAMNSSPYVFRP